MKQKETNEAKETENNGVTYTPPKTDNSGTKPLPAMPAVPNKPKSKESIPPVKSIEPAATEPEENKEYKSRFFQYLTLQMPMFLLIIKNIMTTSHS